MKNSNKYIRETLKKAKSTSATREDIQKMNALFHDEYMEYSLKASLKDELEEFETADQDHVDYREMFARIWDKTGGKTKKRKTVGFLMPVLRIAAVLLIGLVLGAIIMQVGADKEIQYYSAKSPKGNISNVFLPDGSEIFLNAESQIRYTVEGEKGIREVFLTGEAFFDVAKDEKHEFIVHTSAYDIQVTGTRFNVRAYEENRLQTTLLEGSVNLHIWDMSKDIPLKPGQQAELKDGRLSIRSVDTSQITSWKEGKILFNKEYLPQLAGELERKYNVNIELDEDDRLNEIWYSGKIDMESLEEVLDLLKTTAPIDYKVDPESQVVTIYYEQE